MHTEPLRVLCPHRVDKAQINSPGDLARTCRTCRVLHYMTLPQLYNDVALHSYDFIRYSQEHGRPEGCGMASPFTMALNGLVSRNIAGNVKSFRLYGDWKDYGVEECAKAGRVPDNDMMLGALIRVAVEKMTSLRYFRYDVFTSEIRQMLLEPSSLFNWSADILFSN